MDTTYIPMQKGFVYLSAVLDWAANSKNTSIEDKLRAAGGRSGKSVQIELSK
jgi:hypothetical protein